MSSFIAYMVGDSGQELLAKGIVSLEVGGGHLKLKDSSGGEKTLHARVRSINLLDHSILLEPVVNPGDLPGDTLDMAVRLHGHLGPYLVFGLRMGLLAKKRLDFTGHFDVDVTAYTGCKTPVSCMVDGLQYSTGATLGKNNIHVGETGGGSPGALFESNGRRLEIRLTEAALALTAGMGARETVDARGMKAAAMADEDLFDVYER
ncbi:MAG: CooT family nickel-binding protein [Planctomycetes bacterium]|nr:CooT family nickel-binding protein [Planctomycetota bacterium]